MDDDEKRALFRALPAAPPRAAPSASSSASSSLGSSVHTSPPSRPPSPRPPPSPSPQPSIASSASTVEPPPFDPPPPAQQPQPPPAAHPPASPSASSDASTVPPPSPAAVSRVLAALPAGADAPPVVVPVDPRGIDGWEADEAARRVEAAARSSALAAGYPRLERASFRFTRARDGPPPRDTSLSDDARAKQSGNVGILPGLIAACLSPYQCDGVTFMYRLFQRGRGGLLADAMGLGKTVQAIVFLGVAFSIWDRAEREREMGDRFRPARILVVVPTSVRHNWKNEFERWTPFRVELYQRSEEPTLRRRLRSGSVEVLIAGDHPVANYGKGFFSTPCGDRFAWKWDVVIVDEIHIARNAKTNIHIALKELPKEVMFGLTGTAVQNKLKELWSVMSLVVPVHLWPAYQSFNKDFIEVINKGTKKGASAHMCKRAHDRIAKLRRLLAKHMVRRPKSIIEEHLPGKTDYCVLMRMKRDGLQGYMYSRFQNSYDVKLLRDAKVGCDCGSGEMSKDCCHRFPATKENLKNSPIWRIHHKESGPCEKCPNCICLYLQHYSRLLAAHSLLIMPEDDETDREKAESLQMLFRYYLGKFADRADRPVIALEQDADVSCKLNVALKLIRSFQKTGHKTIIFYESLRLGAILQRWATNKRLVFEVIDGSVNKEERQGAVDRFNTNSVCSIFFISKKAGGTGLNICGADRVLIFEPCWNPTLDLQAGDRAHRLGQKRVVHIIRLVVENTIEHYVFKTAITKSQVSSAILDNTKEEWRIREDEIGSMYAMLRMGDVFSSQDGSQEEDYRMIEADKLGNLSTAPDGPTMCGDDSRNALSNGPIRFPEDSADDIDVIGDEVICSLDVDVDDDISDAGGEWEISDEEGMQQDVEPLDAERLLPIRPESQAELDEVLCEEGASGKLVMSSTSARKKKRQLMGVNATQRTSGINPGGAAGVDFDDAAWKEHMSQENAFDADEDASISPAKRRRAGSSHRRTVEVDVSRDADDEEVLKPRRPRRLGTEPKARATEKRVVKQREPGSQARRAKAQKPPKPTAAAPARSAFAARARVRR